MEWGWESEIAQAEQALRRKKGGVNFLSTPPGGANRFSIGGGRSREGRSSELLRGKRKVMSFESSPSVNGQKKDRSPDAVSKHASAKKKKKKSGFPAKRPMALRKRENGATLRANGEGISQ